MTDETAEPENFNDVVRRQLRPPPGRLARRFLVAWGVEVDQTDTDQTDADTDQTDTDNQPPPPAAA